MISKDLFGKIRVTPRPMVEPESVPVQLSQKPKSPNQYKLFMRPQELMDTVKYSVDYGIVPYNIRQTNDGERILNEVWNQKTKELRRSAYSGLVNSIEQHGILRPVTIEDRGHGRAFGMGQGHHRVVAAQRVENRTGRQVYIPVVYSNDYDETEDTRNYPMTEVEKDFRNNRISFD